MRRLALRYQEQIRYFPLPDREVLLGAAAENDLVAPFPGISRLHARLHPEGAGVRITDLGSTNGLVRDGRRLDEVLLTPGREVGLGHAVLTLEDLSSSDGETGLRFQASSEPAADARLPGETAVFSLAAGSSPAAALRFVRELERCGIADPAERLARARRALGAGSLLILDVQTAGEPALVACDGELPSESHLSDLAAREITAAGEVLAAEADGVRLIALLGGIAEPWQLDFFSYLGEKLLQAVPASRTQSPPSPEEELRLPPGMVVGGSAAMRDLLGELQATLRSDLGVLLTGETGTGKELFARLIHDSGRRAGGPFVAVNCAALPAELLEAELFGIAGRVATGVDPRPGLFVQANGGTFFLDEIGELPSASRPSSCGPSRSARFSLSAPPRRGRSTRGSSPPRTATSAGWWRRVCSAPTSTTGCAASSSGCRRCASGGKTCRPSSSPSPRAPPPNTASASAASAAGPSRRSSPTTGRGTSASSKPPSSGPSCSVQTAARSSGSTWGCSSPARAMRWPQCPPRPPRPRPRPRERSKSRSRSSSARRSGARSPPRTATSRRRRSNWGSPGTGSP
jgi:hypothetical protein